MKVLKKDGRLQEFEKNKIYTSIVNASRDTDGIVLNESDIKIIVEDVNSKLAKLRVDGIPTSSYEIIGVIANILIADGFGAVVKEFMMY